MRVLAKSPGGRVNRIWAGIVAYANASLPFSKADMDDLWSLLSDCVLQIGAVPHLDRWEQFDDVSALARNRHDELAAAKVLATTYQGGIRKLLTWLSAPDANPAYAVSSSSFLWKHSRIVEEEFEGNPQFDLTSNDGYPVFYFKYVSQYRSLITPVCRFLADRVERFHNEEFAAVRETIPIRSCDRPGCGRFKFPKRQTKKCYCGDACRVMANQAKKSLTEKRRYKRKLRAIKKAMLLKKKL